MENPKNAKEIAKIIIKRATGRELDTFIVETQKEFKGYEPGKRGIRMDVLVSSYNSDDSISELYDIEPNDYIEFDLAKRTRFYNSMVDVKLLNAKASFGSLPELISIWILPYDPFGDNRMIYTVKNVVTENDKLMYNDGVTNLFLFTDGKIGGSKELRALLKFMKHTTNHNAVDPELKQIQQMVDSIKSNKKVGERYMSLEKIYESAKAKYYDLGKEDGWESGLAEGKEAGLAEGREARLAEGREAGLAEGREAGLAEGLKKGIYAFISSLNDLGISKKDIKLKLLSNFEISETDADTYITDYFEQ